MYDVIVIGAGPAGISTSLYTKRAGYNTLVIHNDSSILKKVKMIQNYYGFSNGISGEELYENGIKQAMNIGVDILKEEVVGIEYNGNFVVKTNKKEYNSKRLVLATGNKRNTVNIEGIKKFEGKGVSYCAVCDAFFYKDKNVALIGNGNYAMNELNYLLNVVGSVTLLTNGKEKPSFRTDNVDVIDKKITGIYGDKKVDKIKFEDETTRNIDGVFIAEGVASTFDFAKKLGVLTDGSKIVVDSKMETNIKGLYACGDNTGKMYQVSKAVYEGAVAAESIIESLKK